MASAVPAQPMQQRMKINKRPEHASRCGFVRRQAHALCAGAAALQGFVRRQAYALCAGAAALHSGLTLQCANRIGHGVRDRLQCRDHGRRGHVLDRFGQIVRLNLDQRDLCHGRDIDMCHDHAVGHRVRRRDRGARIPIGGWPC